MSFSLFDQFEIFRIIPIHPFSNFDISFTNSSLFMGIAFFLFYQLSRLTIHQGKLIPER